MQIKLHTGTLHIKIEQSNYSIDDLIGFAARNNTKRGFLFVSKVLGKHWPVKPSKMQAIHRDLASRLNNALDNSDQDSLYVIGMAETATALGRGVFEEFCELTKINALYTHTTRYRLANHEVLNFAEEHSHATDQLLHMPRDEKAKGLITKAKCLVLIDDEISTGKTFYNLIKTLMPKMPKLQKIIIVSLLDMTGANGLVYLHNKFPFDLEVISLMQGSFSFSTNDNVLPSNIRSMGQGKHMDNILPQVGGRVGTFSAQYELNKLKTSLPNIGKSLIPGKSLVPEKSLILGTGEFMYEPYRLALELEQEGHDIYFQATTRSPILPGNDIKSILSFKDNYGEELDNFLYNVTSKEYSNIILCYETHKLPQGHDIAEQLHASCCYLDH